MLDGGVERIVVRVDGETGMWDVVRRIPWSAEFQGASMALPDGHVFARRRDAATASDYEFVVFPPGGPPRVVWREVEAFGVRLHIDDLFVAGPLD